MKLFYSLSFFVASIVLLLFALSAQKTIVKKYPQPSIISQSIPVLFIKVEINRKKQTLALKSVTRGTGSVPDYKTSSSENLQVIYRNKDGTQKSYFIPVSFNSNFAPSHPAATSDITVQTFVLPYEADTQINIKKTFSSITQELTVDPKTAPQASTTSDSDYQVEMVYDGDPNLTDSSKTLDIVFITSGYTPDKYADYQAYIIDQADILFGFANHPGKDPYNKHKNILKIRSVLSAQIFHSLYPLENRNSNTANIDQDKVIQLLSSLGIPFDQYVVVINDSGTSTGSYGGIQTILFSHWGDRGRPPLLFAHEFSHSFAALLDEYFYNDKTNEFFQMGRNCKADPSLSWPNNISSSSFPGCGNGANLFRSSDDSIMRYCLDNEAGCDFNDVSKYLIEQALLAYTQNKVSLISDGVINIYRNIDKVTPSFHGQFNFRSINNLSGTYHAYLDPPVNWVEGLSNLDGQLPGAIPFTVNQEKLAPGIYQTNFVVKMSDTDIAPLIIPIKVVASRYSQAPAINIISPSSNSTIGYHQPINFEVNSNNFELYYKRIDYYQKNNLGDFIIYSRTTSPYSAQVDQNYSPGPQTFYALGVPYDEMLSPKKSNIITVTIADIGVTFVPSPTPFTTPTPVPTLIPTSTPTPTLFPTPTPILEPSPTMLPENSCDQLQNLIQIGYGTTCGEAAPDPKYNVRADLNKDQKINGADFSLFTYIKSQPNSNSECALKMGDSTDICPWANSCSVLYGKITNSYQTSCTEPQNSYRKYLAQSDLNKDGFINGADFSLFSAIPDKFNFSSCQSFLTDSVNPCTSISPTP